MEEQRTNFDDAMLLLEKYDKTIKEQKDEIENLKSQIKVMQPYVESFDRQRQCLDGMLYLFRQLGRASGCGMI